MGLVYFLGAGFSAAYRLPVMNQFFGVAKKSGLLSTDEKRFLAEMQRFAHMGVRLVTISRNNMEEILSFLEMAEQAEQIPPRLKELCVSKAGPISPMELLRSIIARVYGQLQRPTSHQWGTMITFGLDSFDPVPRLARGHQNRTTEPPLASFFKETSIITTNYDLCLETQLLQMNPPLKLRLPGDWLSTEGNWGGQGDQNGIYDPKSPATLLRLHGAVNWQYEDSVMKGKKYSIRVVSSLDAKNKLPWATGQEFYEQDSSRPVIVAPTVLKHQADGPCADQWRGAAKALAEANHLIFIGYSFPESDAFMRYFLGASLAENVDLESIVIVDPNATKIVEQLRLGSRYGAHFLDMLRPCDRRWEDE